MNAINTSLTTSGNSVAVRLPKELLRMSGLGNKVKLEARQGKIIISRASNPERESSNSYSRAAYFNGSALAVPIDDKHLGAEVQCCL